MQDILIYGGIACNIIGALLLAVFAIQTYSKFKQSANMTLRVNEEKARWAKKRMVAWGLILGGSIIAIIGCSI